MVHVFTAAGPSIAACLLLMRITPGQGGSVAVSLEQRYGRAVYSECRLNAVAFEAGGHADLQCTRNDRTRATISAHRDLTSDEKSSLMKLVRASDLCGGGHIGTDPTPGDGVFEMLRADCGDGRVAILVASGNPTFEGGQARRQLLDWLHARHAELERAARTSTIAR